MLLTLLLLRPATAQWEQPPGPEFRPPQVSQQPGQVPAWIVAASVKVQVCTDHCWLGSGTVFHVDSKRRLAFVLTNHHVVPAERSSIKVTFPNGRAYQAAFICTETDPDVSIVAIQGEASTPYVPLAEASPPAGTPIYQVGYPGGHGPVPRQGVSRGMRSFDRKGVQNLDVSLGSAGGDSGSGIFRASDGKLCGVLWGGIPGTSSTKAVPIEYVHKMIREVDAKYTVIVGVGVIRDRPPQQPVYPQQPPAGIVPPPVVSPIPPAPPQPDPLIETIRQDLAAAKAVLPTHAKAISDLNAQLQQTAKLASDALNKAGSAHTAAGNLGSTLSHVQDELGRIPQLAGLYEEVKGKLPQLGAAISDVNSKVPAIAAKVEALAAAGGASTLPLIGAIGGPVGAALGLAAMLLAALAKKGGTPVILPANFPGYQFAQQQQHGSAA
jgi:hypothetical protein